MRANLTHRCLSIMANGYDHIGFCGQKEHWSTFFDPLPSLLPEN